MFMSASIASSVSALIPNLLSRDTRSDMWIGFGNSHLSQVAPSARSAFSPVPSHLTETFLQPCQPPGKNRPNLQGPNQVLPPLGGMPRLFPVSPPAIFLELRHSMTLSSGHDPPLFSSICPLLPTSLAPCLEHRELRRCAEGRKPNTSYLGKSSRGHFEWEMAGKD